MTVDWQKVADLIDADGYMSGVDRMSDRVKETGEVFTPTVLVVDLLKEIPVDQFAPTKTVIDPACGDGQFLVGVLAIKMFHFGMSREDALKDIYGVDIMRDNVDLCKRRLGGGNIVMGNTLDPTTTLEGQTPDEARLMRVWFSDKGTLEDFL